MKNRKMHSLSTKIVFSIAAVSVLITVVIFFVSEKITKESFHQIETEKADIIAKTIEPLIALNIYLDMTDKVEKITQQLMENPNILAVIVFKEGKVISETISKDYAKEINNSFKIQKDIFQPNYGHKIGTLVLVYSNKHYKTLVEKYTNLTILLVLALGILFILFGLYVKRLLLPLKNISKLLKDYSPNKNINIPQTNENNEIGLISNALNDMQEKISEYSKKQKNINAYLEEKVSEKTLELSKQLYTDALTGLNNRHSLVRDIDAADDGALLIINIDDFKEINDFFGHVAGDSVLKKFSNRLNTMCKKGTDMKLVRLSGDEFAIFFAIKPPIHTFTSIAQKIIHNIEKMIFFHEKNEIGIRVTIGGTYQIDKALEKADIALKSAKKQRKSFLLYDEKFNIEKQYKDNMEWVKKLKKAIDADMIVPYFQPIYDNISNNIVSYECLIRLRDNRGNITTPNKFLTIAKKSRLYSKLTKIMIEKSCRHFEHIESDFSINLSVEDILDKEIMDYLKNTIMQFGVAEKIIFEILESEGIENYEEVALFIDEMKKFGCRTAIDDFGSGYSNFEHLLKLKIDYIKLDGTLIKNLHDDKNAQIIVETIVDFAKRLNILTIAEFVHNENVYKKVKELGVNRSQGFFLSEPKSDTQNT